MEPKASHPKNNLLICSVNNITQFNSEMKLFVILVLFSV